MKKTITTITLAVVMTLGATFANAGIIMSGKGVDTTKCTEGIIMSGRDGIIVAGRGNIIPGLVGTIVTEITGIIMSGKAEVDPCTANDTDGIIVAG